MRLAKLEKLKRFSISVNRKLTTPSNPIRSIPKDFLTPNLITRRQVYERRNKLLNCHSKIYGFRIEGYSRKNGDLLENRNNILYGNFCNQYLICPICARRRADIIRARYLDKIINQAKNYKYKYFITFTIRGQENFNVGFNLLQRSLKRFRLKGQKRELGFSGGEAGKIKSAIGCGEVKTGRNSGQWHIHYHFLAFTNDPLNYEVQDPEDPKKTIKYHDKDFWNNPDKVALLERSGNVIRYNNKRIAVSKFHKEWYNATDQQGFIVDVKEVPLNADIRKTAGEVVKYASKVNELKEEHLVELLIYKDKKKFLTTWGDLRESVEDPDIEEEEDLFRVNYFDTVIFNYEFDKYNNGSIKDNRILFKLINKRDKIQEYRSAINTARAYKNRILDSIKKRIKIDSRYLNNDKIRMAYVHEVDSIRKAYKYYIEKLFRYIVDIKELRHKKYIPKNLHKLEKVYYKKFEKLRLHNSDFII